MDMQEVEKFFDTQAQDWDMRLVRNEESISRILTNASLGKYMAVLDVACGTGVLVPDYIERGLDPVYCLDISGEMIKVAKAKFPGTEVKFVCDNPCSYEPGRKFDRIIIFNAFCHFPEPEKLIAHLSKLLKKNGMLVVAQDLSRQELNAYHAKYAPNESIELMPAEELKELFEKYLRVTTCIDDEQMYQVCGKKR